MSVFVFLQSMLTIVFAVTGVAFMLLAAVGIVVMNDLYTRMQAASKAATLGAACCLFAVATHFAQPDIAIRALLAAGFLFFTSPVAAHLLARAAYLSRTPLAPETGIDDLRGRYDQSTHELSCPASMNVPAASTAVPMEPSAESTERNATATDQPPAPDKS